MSKRIGIKVGSALITDGNGAIDLRFVGSLCQQIAFLKTEGQFLFLVTSGAIASEPDKTMSENLRSAIGQPLLMSYYHFFLSGIHGLKVAQFLPSYQDLANDAPVFPRVFREALLNPLVVPIINYPDAMDNREVAALHQFADNDRLFEQCCNLIGADLAVIASEDRFRDDQGMKLARASVNQENYLLACCRGGNSLGHGKNGMQTKIQVLCSLARLGVESILVSGREEEFIRRAFAGEEGFGMRLVRG
jgi:glutamate 5-kinase